MKGTIIKKTYCTKTQVLLKVRVKKSGHSRYLKIYDKADFELAGLRIEIAFKSPKS